MTVGPGIACSQGLHESPETDKNLLLFLLTKQEGLGAHKILFIHGDVKFNMRLKVNRFECVIEISISSIGDDILTKSSNVNLTSTMFAI